MAQYLRLTMLLFVFINGCASARPDRLRICRLVDPNCGLTTLEVVTVKVNGCAKATEIHEVGPARIVPGGSRRITGSCHVIGDTQ